MTSFLRRFVVAAIAFALHATAPIAHADDLTLTGRTQIDARMQELTFATSALASPTSVRVLLPPGYDGSGATRYPVVYLLHGSGDDPSVWQKYASIEDLTTSLKAIVVMPDGGHQGLYTDWYNDGAGGQPAYETFHVGQLVPWIDANYPTAATRSQRAIGGVSMGGGGAMSYAAKHPDVFGAAQSMSGLLDYTSEGAADEIGAAGQLNGTPGTPFGPRATQLIRWRGANPSDLALNLGATALWAYTGNGQPGGPYPSGETGVDSGEASLHGENETFVGKLRALNIPIDYDDYGPGAHRWPYWTADLRDWFGKLATYFASDRPAPTSFSYTSIASRYDVFGWTVDITRPAVEFSTLSHASSGGFSLTGSGQATVTTGPMYAAGQKLSIAVTANGTRETAAVTADGSGRARVSVDLGEGNDSQQAAAAAPSTTAQVTMAGRRCTVRRVATIRLRGVRARDVSRVSVRVGTRRPYALRGARTRVKVTLAKRSKVTLRVRTRGGRTLVQRATLSGTRTCV